MHPLFSLKNIILRVAPLAALLWIGTGQTACKKENNPSTHTDTLRPYIMDQIAAKSGFSLLNAALARSGVDTLLKDKGTYTFLAPTDQAFQSAGFNLTSINQLDKQRLNYMMKYLVLPGILRGDTVLQLTYRSPLFPLTELWNMDSLPLPLTYLGGNLYINGNPLTLKDSLQAANGLIYPLSSFPQAPVGTVYQTLQQMGCHYMAAAVYHSNISSILTSSLDTIALLAPTDQAFINAGYPDTPSLLAEGPIKLTSLVKAHLFGYRFSNAPVYGGPYGQAFIFPAGVTRRWVIQGLAHDGSQNLTRTTDPWSGAFYYTSDIYQNTLLYQTVLRGSPQYDLVYMSDGTNYSFYRQTFINDDSATIGKVITPNISATNGLIHLIDHVLPQD